MHALQIVGPHHASASEAFPAAAGVADRAATEGHYGGSPGAGVEGAQQWQPPEPAPVDPRDAAGPGKRRVPWEGMLPCCTCAVLMSKLRWVGQRQVRAV